ncbi:hypothetical protein KUCAC02_034670, partial [Chaenocephalus aceratus]
SCDFRFSCCGPPPPHHTSSSSHLLITSRSSASSPVSRPRGVPYMLTAAFPPL